MAETQRWQALPTQLERAEFEQFVLPHLSIGSRGPAPKLSLYKIFNYILKILYLGCQWKELPIHKDGEGQPESKRPALPALTAEKAAAPSAAVLTEPSSRAEALPLVFTPGTRTSIHRARVQSSALTRGHAL
jgi:hypothetical protein